MDHMEDDGVVWLEEGADFGRLPGRDPDLTQVEGWSTGEVIGGWLFAAFVAGCVLVALRG